MHALLALVAALALPLNARAEPIEHTGPLPEMSAGGHGLPVVGLVEPQATSFAQPLMSAPDLRARAALAGPLPIPALELAPTPPSAEVPVRSPRFLMTSPARAGP